jgi:hypothetical protein
MPTRYSRIVPIGSKYPIAVQWTREILGCGGRGECGNGRKPSRTGHRQPLASSADATIMEPPGPAAPKGNP